MNQNYFEVQGENTALDHYPIVFIHGFALDHRMWTPQVEFFAKTHQLITYDLRGFGKSPLPTETYSHHEDLKALLEELKIEKAHLVGLSFGGEAALDFTLAYPDKVISLTLADSSLGGFKSTVDWDVHAKEVGLEAAKQNWLNHEVFKATKENTQAFKILTQMVNDYSGWHWMQEDFWKFRERLEPEAIERLGEISIPTLIGVGEMDLSYFHDIADILNNGIPNSKKLVIPHVGHMVNMEAPEFFNKCLEEFWMFP